MAGHASAVICKTVHLLRCSLLAARRPPLRCTGRILPLQQGAGSCLGMEPAPGTSVPSPAVGIGGLTRKKMSLLNIYVHAFIHTEVCSEQKSYGKVVAACEWVSGNNAPICAMAKSSIVPAYLQRSLCFT